MKNLNKKNTETTKLSTTNKVKKGFRFYCVTVMALTLVLSSSVTAFAAGGRSSHRGQQSVRFYLRSYSRSRHDSAWLGRCAGRSFLPEP